MQLFSSGAWVSAERTTSATSATGTHESDAAELVGATACAAAQSMRAAAAGMLRDGVPAAGMPEDGTQEDGT